MYCILHSGLVLNLQKTGDIPEASGTARACVTFSNAFARPFEISPSVGRTLNSTVAELGNFSMINFHCAFTSLFHCVTATPGVDYNDVIPSIVSTPGDTEACFDIIIINDSLVEENLECLMASFTAEDLDGLEIGNSSSLCCIIDDDCKCYLIECIY